MKLNDLTMRRLSPAYLFGFIFLLWLVSLHDHEILSMVQLLEQLSSQALTRLHLAYLIHEKMPQGFMAFTSGIALGMAGALMQWSLQNPLASPTTLGVASAAKLGFVLGTLLPFSSIISPTAYAFILSLLVTLGLVYGFYSTKASPVAMSLAGMILSLFLGAFTTFLFMMFDYRLEGVFIWGVGHFSGSTWEGSLTLLVTIIVVFVAVCIFHQPISVLVLPEVSARNLGVPVMKYRLFTLILATVLTTLVISQVGMVGFVGFIAPAMTQFMPHRSFRRYLMYSSLFGGLILLTAYDVSLFLPSITRLFIPVGLMTTGLGAAFFLYKVLKNKQAPPRPVAQVVSASRLHPKVLNGLLLVTPVCLTFAIYFGYEPSGWQWNTALVDIRAPRTLVACLVGAILAACGASLQKITRNPMAAPETMGVSASCTLGLFYALLMFERPSIVMQWCFGLLFSWFLLYTLIKFQDRRQLSSQNFLVVGIAVSAAIEAVVHLLLAQGHPQLRALMPWLAGSTYTAGWDEVITLLVGLIGICFLLLTHRTIDVLNLGECSAQSLGLDVKREKSRYLIVVALMMTCATLALGPISFIGLLCPHLARYCGAHSSKILMLVSMLMGANLLVLADWVGRQLIAPWQIPAGLVVSVLAGGAMILVGIKRALPHRQMA